MNLIYCNQTSNLCSKKLRDLNGDQLRTNIFLASSLAVKSAMPHARNLRSTRLSKLQSCALLCLGIPPLLLLACIIRVCTYAMRLWKKLSLWMKKWFHAWGFMQALSDLSLHLVDFVSDTIDGEITRDWILGSMGASSLWPQNIIYCNVSVWGHFHYIHIPSLFKPNKNSWPHPHVWHAGFVLLGVLRWMFQCGEGLSCLG